MIGLARSNCTNSGVWCLPANATADESSFFIADRGLKISHTVVTSLDVMLRCLALVLLFALRKTQPVKSRYLAPFLLMSSLGFYNLHFAIVDLVQLLGVDTEFPAPAFFVFDIGEALRYYLFIIANASYFTQIVAYLAILNLNKLQMKQYSMANEKAMANGQISAIFRTRVKVIKFFAGKVFRICTILIPAIGLIPIWVGLLLGDYLSQRSIGATDILYYIYLVYLVGVIAIPATLVFIVDIISHRKTIFSRRGLTKFFIEMDPFLFRLEISMVVIVVICAIVSAIFGVIPLPPSPAHVATSSISYIFVYLYYIFEQLRCGWIVIIAALYNKIGNAKRKHRSIFQSTVETSLSSDARNATKFDELLLVLLEERGFQLFRQYCESEYSVENLLGWWQIQRFKRSQTALERRQIAEFIYINFVEVDTPLELNIAQKLRDEIATALAANKQVAVATPTALPIEQSQSADLSRASTAIIENIAMSPASPQQDSILSSSPSAVSIAEDVDVCPSPSTTPPTPSSLSESPVPTTKLTTKDETGTPKIARKSSQILDTLRKGRSFLTGRKREQDAVEEGALPSNLFDSIEKHIVTLLSDTFNRFVLTNMYRHYIRSRQEYLDLMKKQHVV